MTGEVFLGCCVLCGAVVGVCVACGAGNGAFCVFVCVYGKFVVSRPLCVAAFVALKSLAGWLAAGTAEHNNGLLSALIG